MARKAPRMAADGLPEPLPVRPVFRPLSIVLGGLAGLAIVFLLQQAGKVVLSTQWLLIGLVGGLVLGVLLPSIPYMLVARRVNAKLAEARSHQGAHKGGA